MQAETTENRSLHAHWDCDQGATCSSLLDACLDAWSFLENLTEEDALNRLCTMLGQALPGGKDDQVISIQRHQQGILKISWEYQGESAALDSIATIIRHCQLSKNVKQQADEIPWSNHVFREGIVKEEDKNTFISMLAVLLILDDIKIYSMSCDPLPVKNISSDSLQFMIGMSTNPNGKGYLEPAAIAILKTMLQKTTPTNNTTTSPPMTLQAVGVGRFSNLSDNDSTSRQSRPQGKQQQEEEVRLMIGIPIQETVHSNDQQVDEPWKVDRLVHMEANLDDITAEVLAFAVEMLLKHGAIDAWTTSIVMKKGRPAQTLHCLCHDDKKTDGNSEKISWKSLSKLIFQHTTTLGIRIHRGLERVALRRSFLTVQTPYVNTARQGRVNIKVGYLGSNDDGDDEVVSVKAEFDHCKEIALETGVSLQQISASALQEAYIQLEREQANKRS